MEATYKSTIAGVPCGILVTDYRPMLETACMCGGADSDHEGFTHFSFWALDDEGNRAEWLEQKATNQDVIRLVFEYEVYLRNKYWFQFREGDIHETDSDRNTNNEETGNQR